MPLRITNSHSSRSIHLILGINNTRRALSKPQPCWPSSIFLGRISYSTSTAASTSKPLFNSMPMIHRGGCHCGAISLTLTTPEPAEQSLLNACQCTFCRKHNARTFSNPEASCDLTVHDAKNLNRYSFGLKTAEAILCKCCGVYLCMLLRQADAAWSTVNVACLDDAEQWITTAQERRYDGENEADRMTRRKARWCPTTISGWPSER